MAEATPWLGIPYPVPADSPCALPDIMYGTFNRTAALVDDLEASGRKLADPPMLRVAWEPSSAQPFLAQPPAAPIRWNTVYINNDNMFRPSQSPYLYWWSRPGIFLLHINAIVNFDAAVPAGKVWQYGDVGSPGLGSWWQAFLRDDTDDHRQAAGEYVSATSQWYIAESDVGRTGFVPIEAYPDIDFMRVRRAELSICWLGDFA